MICNYSAKKYNRTTLKKVDDPDRIEPIPIDRRTLPAGRYHEAGYEARQVFDIDISRVVTEYRAQVLKDDNGNRYVAPFPEGVTKASRALELLFSGSLPEFKKQM